MINTILILSMVLIIVVATVGFCASEIAIIREKCKNRRKK